MSEERDLRLAVLIDADNAPRSALGDVMAEVAVYGTPTIKRIYGDWTTPNLASWKPQLLENAITPVQQYGYTTGKNSTDSAMIIDAMDILYSGNVDGFCLVSSLLVCLFAAPLMGLFVEPGETEIIAVGVEYLRIEGMCYCGIGILFLLYGLFRGLGRPGVSVVLTVVSLGTRVALAYLLAPIPAVGLKGIWWAVPIGWVLADLAGLVLYRRKPLPAETACAPEG